VHAPLFLRHIVKDAKNTDPQFPNRQFVLKRWRQLDQALAPARRHAWLIRQLLANVGQDPSLVEHPQRLEFLDR
jgi:hypothetical protein